MRPLPVAMTDEEAPLIAAARGGSRTAFDALVRRHARATFRLAARVLGNHEDAEDLVQETFVKAYGALADYRGDASFRTWTLRIAFHLGLDHLRRRSREAGRPAIDPARRRGAAPAQAEPLDPSAVVDPGATSPADASASREQLERVRRAVDDLPPRQRLALVLKVYEGLGHADVARVLGTTPGAARVYLALARKSLRRRLAPPSSSPKERPS